jgi:hypothetical protein
MREARVLLPVNPLGETLVEPQTLRQRVRAQLTGLVALPLERIPFKPLILSAASGQGVTIKEFEFQSEPQFRVPGWFIKPTGTKPPHPTLVHVSEHGKDSIMDEPREADAVVR